MVDFAVEHFGGLHVMFNNAGVPSSFDRLLDNDLADHDRVMAVNLFGVMTGTQRAARHMAEHGGGSIINTTSIAALMRRRRADHLPRLEGGGRHVQPVVPRSTSPTTGSA